MVDESQLATLLTQLLDDGLLAVDTPVKDAAIMEYAEFEDGPHMLFFNQRGQELMSTIVGELHKDSPLAEHARQKDVNNELAKTAFKGYQSKKAGSYDAATLATQLVQTLKTGHVRYAYLRPIYALRMDEGTELKLGDITIGPSSSISIAPELQMLKEGSQEDYEDATKGTHTWALGIVEARPLSAGEVFNERLAIALDIISPLAVRLRARCAEL